MLSLVSNTKYQTLLSLVDTATRGLRLRLTIFFVICMVQVYAYGEKWELHPSFDNSPVRIMDSKEQTYFLVHQQLYRKGAGGYDFPTLTLFSYDKTSQEKSISPLSAHVNLSSADIRLADYSPIGKYLIIVYTDGGIDVVYDDNNLFFINILKECNTPGMSHVNSVTFEPETGDAWIATDAGYLHINAENLSEAEINILGISLSSICRFGNKIVAISDEAAREAPANPMPKSFSLFTKIDAVITPSVLLPLDTENFAYIQGAPGSARPLMNANYSDGSWKTSRLLATNENFYSRGSNESLVSRYESNFIPNRNGYLAYTTSKAFQIKAENGHVEVVTIMLDKNPVTLGSWDFENFWFYQDRGQFVNRHVLFDPSISSTAMWSGSEELLRPDAPAAFIATHLSYSPAYGHLVINHGQAWEIGNTSQLTPALLSYLGSRGKWGICSQAYTIPASVAADASLKSIYEKNINKFPIADPHGLTIDPIYSDWIACGSMFGGVMLQNISDVSRDVIRFGSENDTFSNFPGFVAATPVQTWGTMSCFSNVVCDSDGNMWVLFSNPFQKNGSSAKAQIKYLTPEVRKQLYNSSASEIKNLENWKTIDLPTDRYPSWDCKILAPNHKHNKNKIFAFMMGLDNDTFILDHNGTLDDHSDDKILKISKIVDRYGKILDPNYFTDVAEDPNNGDIIITSIYGVFVFNLSSEINNETIEGKNLTLRNGEQGSIVPENSHVNKVIFDSDGRMWIGTNNQGVVGISRDRSKVIARYGTSNSPLPSDCVYGLGWNPESRSLMISTKLGLAEVFPDVATEYDNSVSAMPYVMPDNVVPDYNGNVEIRNLTPNRSVVIRDQKGKTVRSISSGTSYMAQWNLKDDKGARVPGGRYFVIVDGCNPIELVVLSDAR